MEKGTKIRALCGFIFGTMQIVVASSTEEGKALQSQVSREQAFVLSPESLAINNYLFEKDREVAYLHEQAQWHLEALYGWQWWKEKSEEYQRFLENEQTRLEKTLRDLSQKYALLERAHASLQEETRELKEAREQESIFAEPSLAARWHVAENSFGRTRLKGHRR